MSPEVKFSELGSGFSQTTHLDPNKLDMKNSSVFKQGLVFAHP